MANEILNSLLRIKIDGELNISLTGHSLGGALA